MHEPCTQQTPPAKYTPPVTRSSLRRKRACVKPHVLISYQSPIEFLFVNLEIWNWHVYRKSRSFIGGFWIPLVDWKNVVEKWNVGTKKCFRVGPREGGKQNERWFRRKLIVIHITHKTFTQLLYNFQDNLSCGCRPHRDYNNQLSLCKELLFFGYLMLR